MVLDDDLLRVIRRAKLFLHLDPHELEKICEEAQSFRDAQPSNEVPNTAPLFDEM